MPKFDVKYCDCQGKWFCLDYVAGNERGKKLQETHTWKNYYRNPRLHVSHSYLCLVWWGALKELWLQCQITGHQ